MSLCRAVRPRPTLSGKEGTHPRSSRNSTSPGLSAFRADFKTGTGSPLGRAATTQQLQRAQSQLGPLTLEKAASTPRRPLPGPASPPGPAAATAPARDPRPGARAGGTGAGKGARGKWRRSAPSPPRPPRSPLRKMAGGGKGEKNPFREGGRAGDRWRGARGPCQLRAARPGRGDAPEPGTRAAGRARAEGRGPAPPPPPPPSRPRAAAALCCIVAAHKGGGGDGVPGARLPGRAGGLRGAYGAALPAPPGPPPPAPPAAPRAQGSKRKAYLASAAPAAVPSRPARPAPLWLAGPGSIIDAPEPSRAHALHRGAWRES